MKSGILPNVAASLIFCCDLWLNGYGSYVFHNLYIPKSSPASSFVLRDSFGTYVLDHLAADTACLTGGQVAVVAVGQVDADFLGCLHLETVHGLTGLGDIQLIVVGIAHKNLSPFVVFPEE